MTESHSEQVPCECFLEVEAVNVATLDDTGNVLCLNNHAATAGCDCTDGTDSDDVTETPPYIVVSESDSEGSADFKMLKSPKCAKFPNTSKTALLHADGNEIILARDDCRAIILDGSRWLCLPDNSLQCKICKFEVAASDFEFVSSRHKMCHSGENPYMCTQCGAGYKDEKNLIVHWRSKHKRDRLDRSLQCSECDSCFTRQRDLDEHIRVNHAATDQTFAFQCRECNEQFETGLELNDHLRSNSLHCREYANRGLVCRKRFTASGNLKKHRLKRSPTKHLKTRPRRSRRSLFECSICRMLFTARFDLERHIRRHKCSSFCCDQCTDRFTFLYELHMHTALVHTGSIACVVCSECFGTSSRLLKKHLLAHTGELSPIAKTSLKQDANAVAE